MSHSFGSNRGDTNNVKTRDMHRRLCGQICANQFLSPFWGDFEEHIAQRPDPFIRQRIKITTSTFILVVLDAGVIWELYVFGREGVFTIHRILLTTVNVSIKKDEILRLHCRTSLTADIQISKKKNRERPRFYHFFQILDFANPPQRRLCDPPPALGVEELGLPTVREERDHLVGEDLKGHPPHRLAGTVDKGRTRKIPQSKTTK